MKKTRVSKLATLVEAVITHTPDEITTEQLFKEVPELGKIYIQNALAGGQLFRQGYTGRAVPSKARKKVYPILKRIPHVPHSRAGIKYKQKKKDAAPITISKGEIKPKEDVLYSADIGESIILAYNNLKTRFNELGSKYSFVQTELNKEKNAHRQSVKERDKSIGGLKETVGHLRTRIKEIEAEGSHKGSGISMKEVAQINVGRHV